MRYQDLRNGRFYNEDCFDAMATIPDGVVDMILCDLPYGTTACKWDAIIPFGKLWAEYNRLIKDTGAIVLTAAQPFTTALIASNYEMFRYCWIWDKGRATNFMSAKLMALLKTEDVCIFSKSTCNSMSKTKMQYYPQNLVKIDKKVKNGKSVGGMVAKDRNAVFEEGKEYTQENTGYPTNILEFKGDKAFHPTQKPVALFEYLIKTYTNEGQLVLDNTAGSGTTAIAAINTNRKWVCIERDEVYADKAIERIKKHDNET
jgi:site-specific DNA-methyltransferase (adenine-specific)